MASIRVCSYSMHGYKTGLNFLKSTYMHMDLICLQEHWLRFNNLNLLNVFLNCSSIAFSGMYYYDIITEGRP